MTRMSVIPTLCLIVACGTPASAGDVSPTIATAGPFTIIVAEGQHEPSSIGSYSVRVYRGDPEAHGDFVAGTVAKRDGSVAKAWVSTLKDQEKVHHAIVWCQSAGSGSYGSLAVYEIQQKGRLRKLRLPKTQKLSGYMGHDRFFTEGNTLYREFPLYQPGDPNSRPSGGSARYMLDWKNKRWTLAAGSSDKSVSLKAGSPKAG